MRTEEKEPTVKRTKRLNGGNSLCLQPGNRSVYTRARAGLAREKEHRPSYWAGVGGVLHSSRIVYEKNWEVMRFGWERNWGKVDG